MRRFGWTVLRGRARGREARSEQASDEANRQNRLPSHFQAADHHAVGLRNAAAAGHRLFFDHPCDGERGCDCGDRPRCDQPRGFADARVDPARGVGAVFDAETVEDDEEAGNQADENAGSGHLPFQVVESRDQFAEPVKPVEPVVRRHCSHRTPLFRSSAAHPVGVYAVCVIRARHRTHHTQSAGRHRPTGTCH